ncbi:MAG: hypothetical protein Q7T73_05750 [Beijerinckiaceae bacterium]|nr:hypothetical protein [Beijerinckiaceae bacterium]
MRRLLKFLHTLGAIGMMGAMVCLLVLLAQAPPPAQAAEYAALYGAMGRIAGWVLLPSLGLTLVSGLLSMAANRAYQNAGWALVKLATGVLVFEAGFAGVVGPLQDEAERSAQALANSTALVETSGAIAGTIWVLMAIGALNVALGVWRPRMRRRVNLSTSRPRESGDPYPPTN